MFGIGGVGGLGVQVARALDDVVLHDLDHAFEGARIAAVHGLLVEAALARLEAGGLVEVPGIGPVPDHPVIVPHGPVGIDHREAAGRVVDDRRRTRRSTGSSGRC